MIRRKKITAVFILLTLILFQNCIREAFRWGSRVGDITYSRDVRFLSPEDLLLIKESTPDTLIVNGLTENLQKIKTNDILVMGISDSTPCGLLRKVTGVSIVDSTIKISYTTASLTDAILEGTIRFHEKLLEKDFSLKSKVDEVLVEGPAKSFDGLAITLDNLEIYNDGTKKATLNGSIGISPEIDLTISIESGEIKEIDMTTTLNRIDEMTISSTGAMSGGKEIVAAEFVHSPVKIDSLTFIPQIAIRCGFSGSVSGPVTSGVRQDRTIVSCMIYKNGAWTGDPPVHSESWDFSKPQIVDNSDLRIYSWIDMSTKLCDVPLQTVSSEGFYSLHADKTASPQWTLFIGSEGSNIINAGILGLSEDYSLNMDVGTSEIANAGNP